jgi:ribosomal protein L27
METAPSSRRNRYVAIVSIVLVVVALVVWMVIRLSAPSYDLTIASTAGGSVTTPGEAGPYNYDEGTVVNLVAEAEDGYEFVNWTGNVSTIIDVNAAATTITMNGGYSITANFVAVYDLIISSTAGGSVTTPGEGTFTYDEGTVVNLVATPGAGYHFVNWTGDVGTINNAEAATTTITMSGDYSITANFGVNPMVAAGYSHTVGLKTDGTVVAVGDETFGRCNVDGWTNIVQVAAGGFHTVGVKSDGTVVAVGRETAGQLNVGGWTDIVQVAAGEYYTVGLKSDGTVLAVGSNGAGQCDVGGWTDIVQIAAGEAHTLGLKSDGSVVTAGDNSYLQRNIGWTNVVQVAAGRWHTLVLGADGTVHAIGYNDFHQCDVYSWTDITQVDGGGYHTVGLKSDDTVVVMGRSNYLQDDVDDWTDIVQVAAGEWHTVGLKSDGTVVAVGYVIGDVSGWDLD